MLHALRQSRLQENCGVEHENTNGSNDTPVPSKSDQTLLRRFRGGEEDAATSLYLRYAKRLQRLAARRAGQSLNSRFDPEDIVQSVFRTFFRRVALGHYQVPDGEELWKLLLVITLNKIRSQGEFHRAAKRDAGKTVPLESHDGARNTTPDETAFRMLQITVHDLIDDLSAWQQSMIMLRIDGHDVQSIAEQSGKSRRTVERTLQQFRHRLREVLDDERESES